MTVSRLRSTAVNTTPHRAALCCLCLLVPALLAMPLCGCARPRTSEFQITNFDDAGRQQRYRATFEEAYYGIDGQGNLEVVLRNAEPSERDRAVDVVQILYLRTVWKSIPGRTVAESGQINATVSYHLLRGRDGTTFEGAGSVFFLEHRNRCSLEGSLDLATLKPTRNTPEAGSLFLQAELTGEFVAERNPRNVVRIVNEMERLFRPTTVSERSHSNW